jgi:hypothetical protein
MAAILKDDDHIRHFSRMIVRQPDWMCNGPWNVCGSAAYSDEGVRYPPDFL